MTAPVAEYPLPVTKLHRPSPRSDAVRRSRLTERLAVEGGAVTVISAPAGFGKTSLLAEWLGGLRPKDAGTAWLALDDSDNEPAVFWFSVLTAIRRAAPGVGESSLAALHAAQPLSAVVAALVNDLYGHDGQIVLVLDDYHAVHSSEVHASIGRLIEHLPDTLRLVLASRSDPPLALAGLRARGRLVEIRARDLRFTSDETAAYLNETMGLRLAEPQIDSLGRRTEGWIAALQLAALSLRDRDDVDAFIDGFAGDDRFVVDYLVEEVIDRQPEPVRSFLLHTAVLDRLTGSLCDAVTGTSGGKTMLVQLERSNLFLVALDDRRHWYRYHHLFGEVLRARLLDETPAGVHELHRRASAWYAENGDFPAAVHHAMAAGDSGEVARLVELAAPTLRRNRQERLLRGWLEALPGDVFADRPVLAIGLAGARMAGGETAGVEALLEQVEAALARPTSSSTVYDLDMFDGLPAQVAVQRAGLRLLAGDVDGTVAHASRALELIGPDDHFRRASATALLALAQWTRGHLDAAIDAYTRAIEGFLVVGHVPDMLGCSLALADIQIVQGQLRAATRTFERGLRWTSEHPGLRGAADMHVGLSEVLIERNLLDEAARHLAVSEALGESAGLPQHAYRWRVVMARLCRATGDSRRALELIDEAEPCYDTDFSPPVRPVAAIRARVQLGSGDVEEAQAWADASGLSAEDELSYVREYEHITLARVLLARGSDDGSTSDRVVALLDRLHEAARSGGRVGSAIEILVLRAVALRSIGETAAALATLEEALELAEPEGHVRVFLHAGPDVAGLLRALVERPARARHVRRVLAGCEVMTGAPTTVPASPSCAGSAAGSVAPAVRSALIDPLSPRELDVLRLLRTDLSGPEIARELHVSLNTLRTHTKHIFTKLGASGRREALRRAAELGI